MADKETKQDVQVDAQSPAQLEENVNAKPKHELATNNAHHGFNALNLFDEKQLAAAENFLTKVMRSKKGGFDNINDGLAVLMRAQDLNLPFSSCLEHIHVINGKTGVDIHIVKALLSRVGVVWRTIKDYSPLYEFTDGFNVYVDNSFPDYVKRCTNHADAKAKQEADKDGEIVYVWPVKWYQDFNGNAYKDYQLNTKQFTIVVNKVQAAEVVKAGKVPVYRIPNKPVDYITEYELTRNVNGEKITAIGHFSYSEAMQAGFFEKDTYKKYPRILISHRAFTLAARDIASDVLMGVMETTELKIVNDANLTPDNIASFEDAEVIDVQ